MQLTGIIIGILLLAGKPLPQAPAVKEGDIIFQESSGDFSKAIQLATHSRYSHCGIIFKKDGQWYVYEAIEPVHYTPLQEWIARGVQRHYVLKRLHRADSVLTPGMIEHMKQAGNQYLGKHYDFYFGWSDERMYCSELVWKIYKQATGLELAALQPLKDFDLGSAPVKAQLQKVYGGKIPASEMIISPIQLFNSPLLEEVNH
ncbi:YiiX family permuted papain-like enzyme [Chitinophaga vietnamensis]|uniref:YiiX family permuted papain-like enzyme n=1 Tax=Chitinophaga vietnamensis TaxID=2593957 RepID=UPI00117794FD|nr:YiiX family permuted papain-like enzyme [Chitinophaga vietnamensis]